MSTPSELANKAELLAAIEQSRSELVELLDGLSAEQMTGSQVQGDWTIKDILAHIAAWERVAANRLAAARNAEALQYPPIKGDADVNAFNEQVFADNQSQPLERVQAEFEAAHAQLIAEVNLLDTATLSKKLPFEWAERLTYQVLISANTHWHYPDHTSALERWLSEQPD